MADTEESLQDLQRICDMAHQFLAKGAALDSVKYSEFFAAPKVASYTTVLMMRLLLILTGEDKHVQLVDAVKRLAQNNPLPVPELQKLPELDADTQQLQQALITTAYFMAAFYPFNPTFQPLKTIVARFYTFRQKTRHLASSSPDHLFITEVERMLMSKDYLTNPEGLKFLIQQASTIEFPEVAPSLIHSVLRNRLSEPERAKEIFETILELLRHPSTSEDMVLALLHMLRSFLLATPIPPTALYEKIQKSVTQYYIWPRPFADCARDVLELLSLEIKAPGAAFRSRFIEEIAALQVPPIPGSQAAQHPPVLTGKERLVSILVDRDIVGAKQLYEILRNTVPPQVPTPELQYRLLYCLFVTCLNVQPDQLGIEYLRKEDIGRFYVQAMQIMEQSMTLDETAAAHYRAVHLQVVKDQIMQSVTSALSFPLPRPPKVPPLDMSIKFANFSDSSQTRDTSLNSRHNYPRRECVDALAGILTEYLQVAPPDRRPLVKIGVIGNDSTIHNLVCAYVTLRLSRPDFFEKLDVRFYFIPATNSDLANFIGSQDKWYGRHVVCLTRCIQALLPQIQIPGGQPQDTVIVPATSQFSADVAARVRSMTLGITGLTAALASGGDLLSELEKIVNPSTVLRSELENYFREAKWPLLLNIYRCECWTGDNQTITIPFFSRAQLGLPAYIEAFRKANDLPATLSPQEVMGSKNFRFSPPQLKLKFLQMNVMNVTRGATPGQYDDVARQYTHIAIASVPLPSDKQYFVHAHPSRAWLELMLLEDPRSARSKNKANEAKTYHVAQVEITSEKNQPFDLLLDGRHYGPFLKIRVSATIHSSNVQTDKDTIMSLPIMTFLPIDFNE